MKNFILLVLFGLLKVASYSQKKNDPVILKINGDEVRKSEFFYLLKKNYKENELTEENINEYLSLFINFKLKVKEAKALGLDTLKSFKEEIKSYRKQLAMPYFSCKETEERLLKEAYERLRYRLRVSHILIKLPDNPQPKDTLEAFKKINEVYNKLKEGISFEKLVSEYSDDEITKQKGGDIGYITAFSTVYTFENVAYSLNVGEISKPFRTKFGYHIIKLNEKHQNLGDVKVAHIIVLEPKDASEEESEKAKSKIYEAYYELLNGKEFKDVALKFSDDKVSAKRGGDLPWFGVGRMVPEFENVAYSLKKGEISQPFKTNFGWHILKKIDERPIGDFNTEKNNLMSKLTKDERYILVKKNFIKKAKNNYNYKFYKSNFDKLLLSVDTNIFHNTSNVDLNMPLFSLNKTKFYVNDFIEFLRNSKFKIKTTDVNKEYFNEFIKQIYSEWEETKILEFEDANLESKYPEFANIMREYYEGILLFNVTDKMVWSKAIQDTTGLKEFFENNRHNYMWGVRYDIGIVSYENDECKRELIEKWEKINNLKLLDTLISQINKNSICLTLKDKRIVSKEDFPELKEIFEKDVLNENYVIIESKKTIFFIGEKHLPRYKELNEVKGLVTADYQAYLEKKWLEELKKKYKVVVFKDKLQNK